MKRYLVTGGTGFLGSALVRHLVCAGNTVRVLDNNLRGAHRRLKDIRNDCEFIEGDIRDAETVSAAASGIDSVCHLAFVNGTEYFYRMPDLVLDVGVRGIINVVDACLKHGVPEVILASSSEVYQEPRVIPTDETVALTIPDPLNPRYSYAGGKLISELFVLNYGRLQKFERVVVFRPHNVYGPDMGSEHVIPQFALRMSELSNGLATDVLPFSIQGTGQQTRAFIYVDDFINALSLVMDKGSHLGIYHIGTMEEVKIERLAQVVAECLDRRIAVIPSEPALGGTSRRCPDIRKITALGFAPKWSLRDGVRTTARWYAENRHICNSAVNMEDKRWKTGPV
jgi:nucleoside-diphosphate-sugar epimerase